MKNDHDKCDLKGCSSPKSWLKTQKWQQTSDKRLTDPNPGRGDEQ